MPEKTLNLILGIDCSVLMVYFYINSFDSKSRKVLYGIFSVKLIAKEDL
tara:strand:+ start:2041 stop:2187 length:147 start_codon:yes stop_codon:yes gene_type:complete